MKKLALIGLFLCLVTTVFTQEIETKDTIQPNTIL
jgi:hypothetical protein